MRKLHSGQKHIGFDDGRATWRVVIERDEIEIEVTYRTFEQQSI